MIYKLAWCCLFIPVAGHWIRTEGSVATTDVIGRDVRWHGVARVKSVADISAFGHDVMNWFPILLQILCYFEISRARRRP